jgi:hypothetical protein
VNGLRRTYVSHQGRYTDRHRKLYAAVWRLVADPASEGVEAAVPKSTRETAEVVEQLRGAPMGRRSISTNILDLVKMVSNAS